MLKKPLNIFKYISLFWIIVLCFNNSVYANSKYASIIIITHESKNISLVKVIKALSKKKYIVKKPKFLRIENI